MRKIITISIAAAGVAAIAAGAFFTIRAITRKKPSATVNSSRSRITPANRHDR